MQRVENVHITKGQYMDDNAKQLIKDRIPSAIAAMLLMTYVFMQQCTHKGTEQASEQINLPQTINTKHIDSQIKNTHKSVDSLRYILNQTDEQILKSNLMYTHVSAEYSKIDSLEKLNHTLVMRAYNAAAQSSPLCAARKNVSVFTEFSNVPAVKRAHKQFIQNKKQIIDLNKKISMVDANNNQTAQKMRHNAIAKIQQYQKQIDSLLNIKDSLIMQKIK